MLGIHQGLPYDLCDLFTYSQRLGSDTFQIFIRNNRNLRQREFTQYSIDRFNTALFASHIWCFVVHAPYSMNPATCVAGNRGRAMDIVKEDMLLLQKLAGKKYYVLHPGSANTCSVEESLKNLQSLCSKIVPYLGTTTLCLEVMAGQGNQLLWNYEQLDWVVANIPNVMLCYDTCHAFGAGLNVLQDLSKYSKYIGVLHLNGSKCAFGTRLDRHSNLDDSLLPRSTLMDCYEYWSRAYPDRPIILETPDRNIIGDFRSLKDISIERDS